MVKRLFGLLGLLIGVAVGGFVIYGAVSGAVPQFRGPGIIRALIFPGILIAFGITWLRGGTFGARR